MGIKPASHPATNEKIFNLITAQDLRGKKVLDMGAGRGYMAQQLGEHLRKNGIEPAEVISACDMFPEFFEYSHVVCEKISFSDSMPHANDSFDIVYCIEVLEHLQNPYTFIAELFRITKPGGTLVLSVPNTLNLVSRLSYLLHGFFDLFEPLSFKDEDAGRLCGHIMPLGYFYIEHGMRKAGFHKVSFQYDKIKKSALWLYLLLWPFLKLSMKRYLSKIIKKNEYLYQVNKPQLELINSKEVCCSRSCILIGKKNLE